MNDQSNQKSNIEVPDYAPINNIFFAGRVGGEMVRRMIKAEEEKMVNEQNYLNQLK